MGTPSAQQPPQKPPRTVAEIEADIALTRESLTHTLDALKVELDPRVQAGRLADGAKAKAAVVTGQAKAKATEVGDQAKAAAHAATDEAKLFASDVTIGKPKALAVVGAAAAALVGLVVVVATRRRH